MNYRRLSAHLSNWFEAVCSFWDAGVRLQPHDHGKAKGYVVLLWGELHERKWEEHQGQLVFIEKTVMRAPAFGRIEAADIHDVYAAVNSCAAHLYYPRPKDSRLFPHQND